MILLLHFHAKDYHHHQLQGADLPYGLHIRTTRAQCGLVGANGCNATNSLKCRPNHGGD
jgi:hypothetical protein